MIVTRRPQRTLWVCAITFVSLLCSSRALAAPWSVYSTDHFIVVTDRSERAVRAKLSELQHFRAAWFALGGIEPPTEPEPIPTKIYLFANRNEMRPYLPDPAFAGAFVPTLRANYVVLADTPLGNYRNEVLFHELGHVLGRRYGPRRVPLWYAEGMAELYASVRLDRGSAIAGKPPRGRLDTLARMIREPIDIRPILRRRDIASAGQDERARFYALAWLLTHYLRLSDGGRLQDRISVYLERYARGEGALEAFRDTFGPIEAVNGKLSRYLADPPSVRLPIAVPGSPRSVHARPLSAEQRAVELAALAALRDPQRALALLDPFARPSPAVLIERARIEGRLGHFRQSALLADRARRRDPSPAEASLVWATALVSGCSAQRMAGTCSARVQAAVTTFERYLAGHPEDAEALYGIGEARALLRQWPQAIAAYRAALDRLPWSVVLEYRLGITYANAGNPPAARRHLERVVAWTEHGDSDIAEHAREILKRLPKARAKPERAAFMPLAPPDAPEPGAPRGP